MSNNNVTIMPGDQQSSVTAEKLGEKMHMDVSPLGSLRIPTATAFEVTAVDGNGNPTVIEYYDDALKTVLLATLTLTYDANQNVESGVVTYV